MRALCCGSSLQGSLRGWELLVGLLGQVLISLAGVPPRAGLAHHTRRCPEVTLRAGCSRISPEDVTDGVLSRCSPGHSCSKTVQAIDKFGLKGMPTDEVDAAIKSICTREITHTENTAFHSY